MQLTAVSSSNAVVISDCYYCLNDVTDFHCSATSVSVESYLENGRKLLAAGQLADALTQYHAAAGELHLCFIDAFEKNK